MAAEHITILGKGNIDQMSKALNRLMDMSSNDNILNITHDIVEEWQRQVMEQMPTAIDFDASQSLQTPSRMTVITITNSQIFLTPGPYLDSDKIDNTIAVFAWITDGDIPITFAPSTNLKRPPIEFVYPKDKTTETYFSDSDLLRQRDASGKLKAHPIITKMRGGKDAVSYAVLDLNSMAQHDALSVLTPPEGVQIKANKPLTTEHKDIFKFICSYASAGQMEFTDAGLCKFAYAANTPEQRDRINELIKDMMADIIIIDTGTMGDYYNFTRRTITDNVLSIRIVEDQTVNAHGTFVSRRYILKDKPVLLQWAEMLNQIARCPRELLDTPVNKSPLIISLHLYLIERLTAMPRISNKILYSTIYDHFNITGNDQTSKNKRSEIRTKTRIILNTWKSRKYIKGWHEETKDRQRIAVGKDGKVKRGVQSYCIVIEGTPKLAAMS